MIINAYTAIGILDGFVEPEGVADIIAAARFIRDHGPRGVLAGNGTRRAVELANYADAHGDDEAADTLEGEIGGTASAYIL